ncbi:MAG: hypothetical protein AAF675_11415 [Pseudomonadota bacterium]
MREPSSPERHPLRPGPGGVEGPLVGPVADPVRLAAPTAAHRADAETDPRCETHSEEAAPGWAHAVNNGTEDPRDGSWHRDGVAFADEGNGPEDGEGEASRPSDLGTGNGSGGGAGEGAGRDRADSAEAPPSLPLALVAVTVAGQCRERSPADKALFGDDSAGARFVDRFEDAKLGQALLARAIADGTAESRAVVLTTGGAVGCRVSLWRQRGGERLRITAAFAPDPPVATSSPHAEGPQAKAAEDGPQTRGIPAPVVARGAPGGEVQSAAWMLHRYAVLLRRPLAAARALLLEDRGRDRARPQDQDQSAGRSGQGSSGHEARRAASARGGHQAVSASAALWRVSSLVAEMERQAIAAARGAGGLDLPGTGALPSEVDAVHLARRLARLSAARGRSLGIDVEWHGADPSWADPHEAYGPEDEASEEAQDRAADHGLRSDFDAPVVLSDAQALWTALEAVIDGALSLGGAPERWRAPEGESGSISGEGSSVLRLGWMLRPDDGLELVVAHAPPPRDEGHGLGPLSAPTLILQEVEALVAAAGARVVWEPAPTVARNTGATVRIVFAAEACLPRL